jgi:hypothetical protein
MVLVDCYWDNYPAPPRTMEMMVCPIHAFEANEYIDSMVREDMAVSNYLSKRAKVRLYAPPLKTVRGEEV